MKAYLAGLLNSVTGTYDKTKTTIAGRVAQKTLPSPNDSTQVLGPPLTKFLDVFTDTLGTFLPGMMHLTANNRLFILQATPATGVANTVVMYNFNKTTGVYSYVGKIAFAVASATIVARGFKVDDSNTSNIKIFIGYTATVVTTGGLMMINKVALSNFVPSGFPTFYTAQANDVAGVYHLQAPVEVGGATLMTTLAGISVPGPASANPAVNTKVYAHNGISATHQIYVMDYSSAPSMASLGTSTVTAGNTTGANTTFTMTGNTLAVNDTVVITSNAPTGYTNSAVNGAQTIYYVVATNFVAGSTFSLSATLGGAIVNGSTVSTTATFARALGQCTNLFVAKTANLPSLGGGTLLLTNSENYCVPPTGTNSGQDCVFMSTTTNFFRGKLSELYSIQTGTLNGTINVTGLTSTAGLNINQTVFGTGIPLGATIASIVSGTAITLSVAATTSGAQSLSFGATLWPSLELVNVTGTGIDYVVPVPVYAAFDDTLDRVLYPVNGAITLVKQFINSSIESNYGSTGNVYMEAQSHVTDGLQLATVANFENSQGWVLYSSSTTTGQRGIIAMDLRSDYKYGYSYVVSPVISTPGLQTLAFVGALQQIAEYTGPAVFQYRTAATSGDSLFNTATAGWTTISPTKSLNLALNNFTQFRALFSVTASPTMANTAVTTPAQISEIRFTTVLLAEISDYWDYSFNDSTSAIPTRVGFSLRTAYATGTVPKLYYRAYDTAGNLLTTADTVTNASNFQYSTDSGVTWLPLGTIPNVANTRIRYTYTTPPGVDIRISLKET